MSNSEQEKRERVRSPLTADQIRWQQNLKAAWNDRKRELGLTQEIVADKLGWKTQSVVSQYLNGRIALNLEAIAKFAGLLELSIEDIAPEYAGVGGGASGLNTDLTAGKVPLISTVAASQFDFANDYFEPGDADTWLYCNSKHSPQTFALEVDGPSMTAPYGKSYPHGCYIFVDPTLRNPTTGDNIIAKLKGTSDVTFKSFVNDGGKIYLRPLNPQHLPITQPFNVIGTVIEKLERE